MPRLFRQLLYVLTLEVQLQIAPFAHAEPVDANPDDYINADRPGIADGSNVVGEGRLQIEVGIQKEYRRNSSIHNRTLLVPALVRLGLDQNWEVRLEGNTYSWTKAYDVIQGGNQSEGAAPTSIGIKYHFIDSTGPQRLSLGTILRIFPPSGSRDLRTAHTTGDFRLAADWDFASQWSLNPNVGVAVYEDAGRQTYATGLLATTLNYNPSKTLNLFVDMGIQSKEAKRGKTSVILDAGVAYVIGRDYQLDFSVGSGVAGATPPRPFFSIGSSKRF